MPHALLLSPDDQAVSAITGVLEEMSVTCERPLDGRSAAQMLKAQSFDLVLVDCDSLPAAKLIFDVCRQGNNGNNPVPIAIVDGRAGLPTAFRLGAELILTKPVAKDQARGTIRSAVSRVRKDAPADLPTGESDFAQAASAAEANETRIEGRAEAAAAFSSPFSATGASTKMNSAVVEADETDAAQASPSLAETSSASASTSTLTLTSTSTAAASAHWKSGPPAIPSDDPVLAGLEATDLGSGLAEGERESPAQATLGEMAANSRALAVSSHRQRPKTRGSLFALLALVVALCGGGFYGAWTYQPGFRAQAQFQIDRLLMFASMALPATGPGNPAKPAVRATAASTTTTTSDANTAQAAESTSDSTTVPPSGGSTNGVTGTSAATIAPLPATPGAVVALPASGNIAAAAPVAKQPETGTAGVNAASAAAGVAASAGKLDGIKKDAIAAAPANAALAEEGNTIILSSKGAEKRLAYSVAPKYPAEARSEGAEGTVVLKAVVDESGKIEGVRLVEGNATLATAAIQAVKQWRYRPYVRDGKTQSFQTVVIVDFQRP